MKGSSVADNLFHPAPGQIRLSIAAGSALSGHVRKKAKSKRMEKNKLTLSVTQKTGSIFFLKSSSRRKWRTGESPRQQKINLLKTLHPAAYSSTSKKSSPFRPVNLLNLSHLLSLALITLVSLSFFQACYQPLVTPSPAVSRPQPAVVSDSLRNQVDEWLRQLPAVNQQEAEKIFFEMLRAGSPVVYELGRRLSAPGQADDSLVRYAIDGLVTQTGRAGHETHRERLADDLLKLTFTAADEEIKKFLLEEAQYVVGKKHLKILAAHLKNPALSTPALKAMLRVKDPELEETLLANLKKIESIPEEAATGLIQAIGHLRSRRAVSELHRLAASSRNRIRQSARLALAEIGDPSSEFLLASIPALSSQSDRLEAISLYLKFARRLAENGYKEKAASVAEKAVEYLSAPGEETLRCQALELLAETSAEKAFSQILKAISSEQPAYRAQALSRAGKYKFPGLTQALKEKLGELSPESRAAVIEFLGESQLIKSETLERYLTDESLQVRLAAVKAYFRAKKEEAVDLLLPMLGNSGEEARLIVSLLRTLPADRYTEKLLQHFPRLSDGAKIVVLESLQDLIQPDWKKVVLEAANQPDPALKKAGVEALAQVVSPADLNWLLETYLSSEDPSLSVGFQKAIGRALNQIEDLAQRERMLLDSINRREGRQRAELIKLLPLAAGPESLGRVVEFIEDKNSEIKAAALAALGNWPDFEAASHLANLIKTSQNRSHRYLAFQAITRLMKDPDARKEAKLKILDEIKPLAVYPDEKNFLLQAWASVRDIRALKEVVSFLEEENFRPRAALLACRMARPLAGEEGLSGFETVMLLKKALSFVQDELEIEETEMYLDRLLREEGYQPLFNRKDLSGWKGLVGDPVRRAKMSPEELKAAQLKADEEMLRHWKVVEGVLVFDGQGHNLCTQKDYCDFELWVDWKIEPRGDSGIYLRGSPQVQIWDPAQWPEGSGGLYNNQKNPNKPLKRADNPVGLWNTFYIKMVGERVTVYLNGELVVDDVVMENYWERDKPIYRCGPIELQAHNTPLYFKNIYIREIK